MRTKATFGTRGRHQVGSVKYPTFSTAGKLNDAVAVERLAYDPKQGVEELQS
jgi:hypothetical protein